MSQILRNAQIRLSKRGRGLKDSAKWFAKILIKTLERIKGFYMTPEVNLMNILMLLGRWESGTTQIAKKILKPGMTAVDIGGHVGYYTRLFSKGVGPEGKVFAFEPHPGNRALLLKNTQTFSNVTVNPFAVGEAPGTATFFESSVGSGSHSLIESRYPHSAELKVEKVSLDSFFVDRGIVVNFMKIDVEGAEHEVLDGGKVLLSKESAPDILVEFYPPVIRGRNLEPKSLIEKLQNYGYTIYEIDEESAKLVPISKWESTDTFVASVKKVVNLFVTKSPSRAAVAL